MVFPLPPGCFGSARFFAAAALLKQHATITAVVVSPAQKTFHHSQHSHFLPDAFDWKLRLIALANACRSIETDDPRPSCRRVSGDAATELSPVGNTLTYSRHTACLQSILPAAFLLSLPKCFEWRRQNRRSGFCNFRQELFS
jgi:hypothetical protein